jgi:hypothetical protein
MKTEMTLVMRAMLILLGIFASPSHALADSAAATARPKKVMSGHYSALVITHFEDKDLVQSWLPEGLVLDVDCPYQDAHPVIILSGVQRNFSVETMIKMYPWWGRRYREVFISIPYVKLVDFPDKPPLFHVVRVYLDQWTATELGVKLGWPKQLVKIESTALSYRVFDSDEAVIFESNMDPTRALPLEEGNASFAAIREMLSMPMVLQRPAGGFNVFAFDWHLESAEVHSVPADLQVQPSYLPGFQGIVRQTDGINNTDFGAFYLKTRFTNQKTVY